MEVIIGKTAGFCYGVENAVTKTMEEVKRLKKKESIYCHGEIVHNKQVVEKIEKLGVKTIEKVEEISKIEKQYDNDKVKIVIRAHGVPPEVYEKIREYGYEKIDLTCPNVLAIHQLAQKASQEGQYIFLIGKKDHPETIGTFGFCKKGSKIETKEDIKNAIDEFTKSDLKQILILVQTTFSLEKFNQIVYEVKEKVEEINCKEREEDNKVILNIRNTICNATRLRQEETEKISNQVQYMIIIGGKNSSNTKKLYEIAQKNCENSICIETSDELDIETIKMLKELNKNEKFRIGIMAGASTPKESIMEVEECLKNMI